jgi:hypothetical protein
MKETLNLINQMQADGVIDRYAIAGAVGATFYLEPAATFDIDILVVLPNLPDSALLTLSPIYAYLTSRGCRVEREHIVVGNWPVQFLPAGDDLENDALQHAVPAEVEGVKTWVLSSEYLVALALRTGRFKDRTRILEFLERGAVDRQRLRDILTRHGLIPAWERFERKYLGD